MKLLLHKPDTLGALASSLCVVHCLLTPFIFIAQTCCSMQSCNTSPYWWQSLDYFFLIISFFAVARSAKTTSNKTIGTILWIGWSTLLLLLINEKLYWFDLPKTMTHVAALTLAAIHVYNLNFCQCETN